MMQRQTQIRPTRVREMQRRRKGRHPRALVCRRHLPRECRSHRLLKIAEVGEGEGVSKGTRGILHERGKQKADCGEEWRASRLW